MLRLHEIDAQYTTPCKELGNKVKQIIPNISKSLYIANSEQEAIEYAKDEITTLINSHGFTCSSNNSTIYIYKKGTLIQRIKLEASQ